MYKHSSTTWKNIYKDNYKQIRDRAVEWRKQNTITRLERPTRLDRARTLGYKAKQGIIVVRIKVGRGGMRRPRPKAGRRQKHAGVVKMKANINMKQTSEKRVSRKYPNLHVLNSYFVYKDGKNAWYEVILVDPSHPSIKSDTDFRYLVS